MTNLQEILQAFSKNEKRRAGEFISGTHISEDQAQAAIAELVEAAIPDMKLSDVIDAKQWPTPEEYEKMVWAVTWYDNQIRNNLIKAGVLNG